MKKDERVAFAKVRVGTWKEKRSGATGRGKSRIRPSERKSLRKKEVDR